MTRAKKHLNELLNDFRTGMLVTNSATGQPNARPMHISEITDETNIWFITNNESGKIDEIEADAAACFTAQGGSKFLTMSGAAEITRDDQKLDDLWSAPMKLWFPEGKSDPDIALIKFTPASGEYWDNSGTKRLRFAYEASKAYFTGTEIDLEETGINAKVDFAS